MSDSTLETPAVMRGTRPYIVWAIIIAVGALGIALKEQFGRFMMHVLGKPMPSSQTLWQFLFASEWGWLCLGAIAALFLYQRAGFQPAPVLERLLFGDARTGPRPRVWIPALIGGPVQKALNLCLRQDADFRGHAASTGANPARTP